MSNEGKKTKMQESIAHCRIEMTDAPTVESLQDILLKTVQLAHACVCEELQEAYGELDVQKERHIEEVRQSSLDYQKLRSMFNKKCGESMSTAQKLRNLQETTVASLESRLRLCTDEMARTVSSLQPESEDDVSNVASDLEAMLKRVL